MPYLFTLIGPNEGKRYSLDRPKTLLGRDTECDIMLRLPDRDRQKAISQIHAIITRDDNGKFSIEDGNGNGKPSKNHTYLNDEEVLPDIHAPLSDNDVITICDYKLSFHIGSKPPDSPTGWDASISRDSGSVFSQTVEKLQLLLEISNRLSNTLDMETLLPQVVNSLLKHFKSADRAFLIEVDESNSKLVATIFKTRQQDENAPSGFSESIVRQCVQMVQGLLVNEPEVQFPESSSVAGLLLQSVMCVPLWSQEGKPFGVLLLDSQNPKKKFSEDDLKFLMGVASQASIALANARFHRAALVRERLNRDIALAREVARSFLPAQVPQIAHYEFYASCESALEVGGDYYDFLPLKDGRLAVMVGDVTGKGVAAALVMARFSAEARSCLRTEADLITAVRRLNDLMQPINLTDRFVTLVALLLDPEAQQVTVVNAGHPLPLVLRRSSGAVEEAAPRKSLGPPIAVMENYPYEAFQVTLNPGDNLILFSDGVTDALDADGNAFGNEGLHRVLERGSAPPRKLGDRIIKAVNKHAAGCSQHDDITLVCLGRLT